MIFPDRPFSIEARWPEPPAGEERDIAEITISTPSWLPTSIADLASGSNRAFLRASAVSLALWLVDNYWRLRWETLSDSYPRPEWRLRHELSAVGGGSIWPPIMFYGTGSRVVYAPALGPGVTSGPIRFLDVGQIGSMDGRDFDDALDLFFSRVVSECAMAADGFVLSQLVEELRAERDSEEASSWRRLEARLGFDPDEAPASLIEGLLDLEAEFGIESIEEAASAASGPLARMALGRALEITRASPVTADFRAAMDLDVDWVALRALKPWQAAERIASRLRWYLGLSGSDMPSEAFADLFDISPANLRSSGPAARGLKYGVRLEERGIERLALQTRSEVDRRFEIARLIGDAMWSDGQRLGVVSRSKTDRQKFQRAFAQSFLVPPEALLSRIDPLSVVDADIEQAARFFQVHRNVIRTMLANKGYLPTERLVERLEAA